MQKRWVHSKGMLSAIKEPLHSCKRLFSRSHILFKERISSNSVQRPRALWSPLHEMVLCQEGEKSGLAAERQFTFFGLNPFCCLTKLPSSVQFCLDSDKQRLFFGERETFFSFSGSFNFASRSCTWHYWHYPCWKVMIGIGCSTHAKRWVSFNSCWIMEHGRFTSQTQTNHARV